MRNENFHRHLRQFLRGRPLLGAETLLALLHTFIYSWNARLSGETHLDIAAKAASYNCSGGIEVAKWEFGFPFKGAEAADESLSTPDYDSEDILEIIEATESLASMGKCLSHPALPLTAEDIILRSSYDCLPNPSLSTNDKEECHQIDSILEGMSLKRMEMERDNLCVFKVAAKQLSILQKSALYENFLNQTGLTAKENPLEMAKTLKEFSVKELLCNNKEYRPHLRSTNMHHYRATISKIREQDTYSVDLADLLLRALANVLRTNIVLITATPTCPIMFLRPKKGALSLSPMNLVYLANRGTFNGVVPMDQRKQETRGEKKKRCRCGRKSTTGCISRACSCYAIGVSCDIAPSCHCINCSNKHGRRGLSVGQKEQCCCGKNLRACPSGEKPCSTTRCPCFQQNKPCSACKCKYCNNKHGQKTSSAASNYQTPTKRAYESKHSGKLPRTPNSQFIEQKGKSKLQSRWRLSESILLNEIMNHKMRRGKITIKSAPRLFNYIIKEKPHIGHMKNPLQILQKWKNISKRKSQ